MSIHINRIYTRSGDSGTTRLAGGTLTSKGSLEVESYGDSDELISHLGVVRAFAAQGMVPPHATIAAETETVFLAIQNTLYEAGAELASPAKVPADPKSYDATADARLVFLENRIDSYRSAFEAIDGFTVPGDCLLGAHAHVARTVCRRWERVLVRRHQQSAVSLWILAYANRLSDYLFAYTRWASALLSSEEILWKGPPATDTSG